MRSLTQRAPSSAARPRWGLFVVTALATAALVASAIWSWVGAREAAAGLTEARALTLRTSVARELRALEDDVQPALDALLEDHSDEGLRYVALIRGKHFLGQAGEASRPLDPKDIGRSAGLQRVGDRVRAVRPLRPGDRRRRRAARRTGAGTLPDGPSAQRPPPRKAAVLVLEIEPTVARALETRALTGLALALVVAALLLAAAAAFWRLGRRADTAEEELQRQRHLAALGEMSAVLGHELKNPLASLKGHAQLLEERLEDGSREQAKAHRVVGEAQRLERLIEEVLSFVRSGELQREDVAPADLVRAAVDAVSGARAEVDAEAAPARWSLDARRVGRVLVNLVDNAAKAAPDTVISVCVAETAGSLVITVSDDGPGVPEGELERIFEPFFTTRTKGTGLGLAIGRRIAEAHGGTLTASNHGAGGARFRLVIPGGAS